MFGSLADRAGALTAGCHAGSSDRIVRAMVVDRWKGRILLAPGVAAYVGPVLPTEPHRHHATQLLIAPDGIDLVSAGAPAVRVVAAMVAPDHPHTIASPTSLAAVVLVEPTSARGLRLPVVNGALLLEADVAALHAHLARPLDHGWIDGLFALWSFPPSPAPRRHPGVARVERAIDERLLDGALDAASLAAIAGLSEGRLGHAFREHVGLPVRAYVKWKRLERAALHLGRGANVTEAAHAAGFSDAAHLSRTFRALLGLSPTDLAGHVTWATPDAGDEPT